MDLAGFFNLITGFSANLTIDLNLLVAHKSVRYLSWGPGLLVLASDGGERTDSASVGFPWSSGRRVVVIAPYSQVALCWDRMLLYRSASCWLY